MKNSHPDFEFFESQLAELLKEHRNQFVLIKDQQIHGFYSNVEQALKAGYEKFGNVHFLIQEVTDEKRFNYLSG